MPIHDWTRVTAGTFHDFHFVWTGTIRHSLNHGLLPPGYYAMAEQIVLGREPYVLTFRVGNATEPVAGRNGSSSSSPKESAGVGLLIAPPQAPFVEVAETSRYTARQNRVAVRRVEGDELIAVIEILSPGNKSSMHAVRSLVEKTADLLAAGIHCLLLDLFPPTPPAPHGIRQAVWAYLENDGFRPPKDRPLTLVSYSACPATAYVYPAAVGETLPAVPLFLRPERYVNLTLEPLYEIAFNEMPERYRTILTAPGTGAAD